MFSIFYPMLLVWSEFIPGEFGVNPDAFTVAEEVTLAFFSTFSLEGFDGALFEAEEMVGNRFVEVDANDAAEATAARAGSEGRVEREEGGGWFDEWFPRGGEGSEFCFGVGAF